jgi:Sulfotransferase domain
MRVIGSGFGRTGTLSLQAALQQLGFAPCYHMVELIKRRGHAQQWLAIARGERPDWRVLFDGFEATVDFPACIFYADLLREFPAAKVVHTVRDKADWYRSSYETIYQARTVFPQWLRRTSRYIGGLVEMTERLIWGGVFAGRFEDEQHAQRIFDEYTAKVRATVPADKLLVYDVREGWAPLCRFLDVPIPATPFPNSNDRASMLRQLRTLWWLTRVGPWLLAALIVAVIAWSV